MEHSTNRFKHSEEKCEELKAAHEEQKQKEAKLYDKLHGLLDRYLLHRLHTLYLSKYSLQIEEILDRQSPRRMNKLKKNYGKHRLDHSLNDEPFWIANQDVKELKEWIDEKTGIDVFYGTQFLQSLSTEEMAKHLDSVSTPSIRLSR